MPNYTIAFQDNQVLTYGKTLHHILHCQKIGNLHLPSGNVVARDPMIDTEGVIFEAGIEPGDYPIFLTRAFQDCACDIAFATLRFTQKEVVRWEPAHGKDSRGRPWGYAVDSATGSFMDYETSDLLNQLLEDDESRSRLYELRGSQPWVEFVLPQAPQANIFLFPLLADGGYPSYYGYDANDSVVCIVTDFFGPERKEISAWPLTFPAIPIGFDQQFFSWLSEMNAYLEYPGGWDRREALSEEDLQFLTQSQGFLLPEDFVLHYAHSGFWLRERNSLQEWWTPREAQVRANLKTNKPILPILSDWSGVAVCEDEHNYVIYEQKIKDWDSQEQAFEYPDLKTYLMDCIMRDLGSLP